MNANQAKVLERVIAHAGDLPAMPAVVAEVLTMTDNPSVAMSELSEQIQRDPALTAKILRISNSSYYGMRQYVGTLKLALVILGVREVRNIVVGITVFDTLRSHATDLLLAEDFLNHSFWVAGLSRKLGSAMALGLQSEDFVAGLLHDIGKMVLADSLGRRYAAVYHAAEGAPETLFDIENRDLGFNHADAGMALAGKWNLPQSLCDALFCHHAGEDRRLREAREPRLAALVRIANQAARHDFEKCGESECKALADAEAWEALESTRTPVAPEERYPLLQQFWEELRSVPKFSLSG